MVATENEKQNPLPFSWPTKVVPAFHDFSRFSLTFSKMVIFTGFLDFPDSVATMCVTNDRNAKDNDVTFTKMHHYTITG